MKAQLIQEKLDREEAQRKLKEAEDAELKRVKEEAEAERARIKKEQDEAEARLRKRVLNQEAAEKRAVDLKQKRDTADRAGAKEQSVKMGQDQNKKEKQRLEALAKQRLEEDY